MIRVSEAVLPGHPDKFCDQVADGIVADAYAVDAEAYCQVEVSTWSDQVFLTGAVATRRPLSRSIEDIVKAVGRSVGYLPGSAVDASQYVVHSTVCELRDDPRTWTHRVNDQCVSVGWAGYDARVAWLPPEHFLVQRCAAALRDSCVSGRLRGHGPDGKLLVRLRDSGDHWEVEHVLVTLQHREDTSLRVVAGDVVGTLKELYRELQARDARWRTPADEIEWAVNPNGVFVDGGSQGDNGQTGRKLVMDYYGPRVAIGGGALSGKDLSHIDRVGAYAARQAAVRAVAAGAGECRVVVTYAPNCALPLDVTYEMERRAEQAPTEWFAHDAVRARYAGTPVASLGRGGHFSDLTLPWNQP